MAAGLAAAGDAATQTQRLTLQPGWNGVWLDPSPHYSTGEKGGQPMSAEDVFTDAAITVVARPLLPAGSAEFVTSPTSVFNQEEWLVWYRNPEALLNTLSVITGNQAYYVKVDDAEAVSVDVSGEVSFFVPDWTPASYNLVGFNLSAGVSFADFFGSTGEAGGNHPISDTLRLDPESGLWVGVQPDDLMTPGEAYWIKSVRNSTFAGPVSIAFDGLDRIAFGSGAGDVAVTDGTVTKVLSSAELTFTNVSADSQSLSMELIDPLPADELKAYEVVPGEEALTHEIGPAGQIADWDLGALAAASTRTVTLGASRDWTTGDVHRENLYRIDVGSQYFWLPVRATNLDVTAGDASAANPAAAGLWVSEVVLDTVSQVDGSGLAPATTNAPMRLIVHADDAGNASLLGHVLFMQTKTADESVPAVPVLVVDEAKLPFFEGIETRHGKKVGRRIESVAYDLPRRDDPDTQSGIIDEVAAENDEIAGPDEVTAEDIELFLNARTSRPPALVESYHLTWPLEGGLQAGGVLRTGDGSPLTLDPFHRSNPFRHAFHPQHGAGFAISRSFTISFDAETASSDMLTGLYQESVSGLAASAISTRGTVRFVRFSTVTELQ
ncbi:MAG TPA: hypothetical protein VMN36_05555 [Verrucomicrobiales bacterium]|nr:hypothetical protein [Verrucomicrobiales bacterium]